MITGRPRKLVQVSATLDPKLGGPVAVVVGINEFLEKEFDHSLLVFGKSHVITTNLIQENTLFQNRYGVLTRLFSAKFRDSLVSADLILVHGFYLYSTLFALFFAKTELIYIMPHGSLENYQSKNGKFRKRIFEFFFHCFLNDRQLTFLVGSEPEVISVKSKFPNTDVKVVGLGVDFYPDIQKQIIVKNQPIYLYCMSRITAKKRLDLCIHALSYLKDSEYDFRLSIYGSNGGPLEKELRVLTDNLHLSEKVEFKGFVSEGNKESSIKDSHILLLPSENENFAVAVAESIGNLRPVLVSKFVAMHEFVDVHGVGVTIDILSAVEIANGVLRIVQDFEKYSENCFISRNFLAWTFVSELWINELNNGGF